MELTPEQEELLRKYPHYYKDVRHLAVLDVYRIIDLFNVLAGPQQHALKKVLLPGLRKKNTPFKDVNEARDALTRWITMMQEDELPRDSPLHVIEQALSQTAMVNALSAPLPGTATAVPLFKGTQYYLEGCRANVTYKGPCDIAPGYQAFEIADEKGGLFTLSSADTARCIKGL